MVIGLSSIEVIILSKFCSSPAIEINFLKDNSQYLSPQGWMNFDLKVSKDGATLYFEVNTWKPLEKPSGLSENDKNEVINARESHNAKVAGQDIDASSIPF